MASAGRIRAIPGSDGYPRTDTCGAQPSTLGSQLSKCKHVLSAIRRPRCAKVARRQLSSGLILSPSSNEERRWAYAYKRASVELCLSCKSCHIKCLIGAKSQVQSRNMLSALQILLLKSSLLGVGLFQFLRHASLWLTRLDFHNLDREHGALEVTRGMEEHASQGQSG